MIRNFILSTYLLNYALPLPFTDWNMSELIHHSPEEEEEVHPHICTDRLPYGTCLENLFKNECSLTQKDAHCQRTCQQCDYANPETKIFHQDYCYDTIIEINLESTALYPLSNKGTTFESIETTNIIREQSDFCYAVFMNDEYILKNLNYNQQEYLSVVEDFSCHGPLGDLCKYTCGKCQEHSVDQSRLECYIERNRYMSYYLDRPEFITSDSVKDCHLSGKDINIVGRFDGGNNNEEEENFEEENEEYEGEYEGEEHEEEHEEGGEEEEETNEWSLVEAEDGFLEAKLFPSSLELGINVDNIESNDSSNWFNEVGTEEETNETTEEENLNAGLTNDLARVYEIFKSKIGEDHTVHCVEGAKYGNRVEVDCKVECSEESPYINLTKRDGKNGEFKFICRGWGKFASSRRCVNKNCLTVSGKNTDQCNKCNRQFTCDSSNYEGHDLSYFDKFIDKPCEKLFTVESFFK